MSFPTSIPPAGSASPSTSLQTMGHTALHNDDRNEIRAIAQKIGTGFSTPVANRVLIGDGTGTSSWSQVNLTTMVTGTLPVANGGTGATTSTGSGVVVLGTSPTITTPTLSQPTVGDFTDAQHDHTSNSEGGALGANSVDTTQMVDNAVTDDKMDYPRWYKEIGRATATGATDTLTVSSLPSMKYLQIKLIGLATGGTIGLALKFNSDGGANYATRRNTNNGVDATATSSTVMNLLTTQGAYPHYVLVEGVNIAAQEKLFIYEVNAANTAGANVPTRESGICKWQNTSAAISSIEFVNNGGTGDFATGTEIVVLGSN